MSENKNYLTAKVEAVFRKNDFVFVPYGETYDKSKHLHSLGSSVVVSFKVVIDGVDVWVDLPVLLNQGDSYVFYNDTTKAREIRKITSDDTREGFKYAEKCLPSWREYVDQLPEGSSNAMVFEWFNRDDLELEINLSERVSNGKRYYSIVPVGNKKAIIAEDEMETISKSLKAAGIKLFGGVKSAKSTAKPAAPVPPKPPKPVVPEKSADEVREDAVTAYCEAHKKDDPQCAKFYERAAEILKRDINSWESWSVADWEKIVADFAMPF